MTSNPLVTIVLPTYNGSRYLRESIQSCIDQTYSNWELIIIDDASTDDTPALIGEFVAKDARVSSVRHEKNRRLPNALNTGFGCARGEYLTWTSDDNVYKPHALDRMVHYLEANPAIGLVYCDMRKIGADGEDLGPIPLKGPESLVEENCIGACFLYRRQLYEAVGRYDPEMVLVEDYDYWLRISRRFPIAHLRGVSPYLYRFQPGSLTSTRQEEVSIQRARALCRHVLPPAQGRQVLLDLYWSALWRFRSRGDFRAAWYCARKCLALAPLRLRHIRAVIGTGVRLLLSGRRVGAPSPKWIPG